VRSFLSFGEPADAAVRGDVAMRQNIPLDPSRTGREARNLEETLRRLVIGQDEAVEQIVNIYQMYLAGMNPPGRPIGNFLFLGPTGSGKTRAVEATAEALLSTPKAVVKIDCAEFQHSHEIAKLIGSPPGYLGHRETHPLLSQDALNHHQTESVKLSFVLFDEIEKASDALWNLLLGILDKASLTLGDNKKVDFARALIFMTSNLGATEMNSLLDSKLGFAAAMREKVDPRSEKMDKKITRSGVEAAKRKFTPEFMNRIDKIVVFKPLAEPELRKILDLELHFVQQRVFAASNGERSFVFTLTNPAKDFLLVEGTDSKYGARHLKRAIERFLVQPLSNLIATQQVRSGDWVKVDIDVESKLLVFRREAEGLPVHTMAEVAGTSSLFRLNEAISRGAFIDTPKIQTARSSRRG
jgi:ATP-dependent Clp protease ATP-binding subunit ClpA